MDCSNGSCWILKSENDVTCSDIPLSELKTGNEMIIGRSHMKDCVNPEIFSREHCLFRKEKDCLVVKSLAVFDVIFVNGKVLKQNQEVFVNDNSQINLYHNVFPYKLKLCAEKNDPGQNMETENGCSLNTKKRSLSVEDTSSSSYSGAGVHSDDIATQQLKRHDSQQITTQNTISICPDCVANSMVSRENDRRAKEGVCMSLADIESSVCMRSHSALTVTKSLCRTLLSSFHCDICLEVIASCRSCVPCGHSYCAPCIQGVIDSGRGSECPKCRAPITQLIPNKTIDTAIADSLTQIKEMARSVLVSRGSGGPDAATAKSSSSRLVSDTQDIDAWTERYQGYEAQAQQQAVQRQVPAVVPVVVAPVPAVPVVQPIQPVAIVQPVAAPAAGGNAHHPIVLDLTNSSDDEGDQGEQNEGDNESDQSSQGDSEDEEQDEDLLAFLHHHPYDDEVNEVGYFPAQQHYHHHHQQPQEQISCNNVLVEHARSGRSVCIHCSSAIAQGVLRCGLRDNHEGFERYIHLTCADGFNQAREPGESKVRVDSLRGLDALSVVDRNRVIDTFTVVV